MTATLSELCGCLDSSPVTLTCTEPIFFTAWQYFRTCPPHDETADRTLMSLVCSPPAYPGQIVLNVTQVVSGVNFIARALVTPGVGGNTCDPLGLTFTGFFAADGTAEADLDTHLPCWRTLEVGVTA